MTQPQGSTPTLDFSELQLSKIQELHQQVMDLAKQTDLENLRVDTPQVKGIPRQVLEL